MRPGRRPSPPPPQVLAALRLGAAERVLAAARDQAGAWWLVATNHSLALVSADGVRAWQRPWHEVEAGTWERDDGLLTVTWADRSPAEQWRLGDERHFLQALRERVQASVVLTQELALPGRRTGRAVIRQDLATGRLVEQVVLGRTARPDDPDVAAEVAATLAFLREQVGMPS